MAGSKKYGSNFGNVLKTLPSKPGVYQFYDSGGKIIYVGKAKNLKKRVSSYFTKETFESGKVAIMVKKVADIRFIIVDTELDAFLLENNLIKKHQPRYNINLKDDKTFPWICIKNEPFPRVFLTRNPVKDGSQYFGPYASVRMVHILLDLVKQLYPLRTCNYKLTSQNIANNKFKVCLQYHIGNCKGPCEGLQSAEEYLTNIEAIREIIKGNISTVIRQLKKMMLDYAESLAFEKAQVVKEKINILEKYQAKSTIVNPAIDNVDVFSIESDENSGYVNYLKVVKGAIVQAHTIELKKKLDEPSEELLALAIAELRQRFNSDAPEIIASLLPEMKISGVKFTIPQRGDRKSLLDLSRRNVKYYRLDKQKQMDMVDPERHTKRILNQMMKDLRMIELPVHIECFDNSNIQGAFPVAAMVVFKNTKPDKAAYRHFNIKSVEGPNDYASMEEVIYRRYRRLLEENQPLPQLIVVDGGKGQLNSALKSLEKLGLRGKVAVIGIAKRLEEIYCPGDPLPLYINKKSETLKIIQQMRDEAHRFGITHHRRKREKATIKSILTDIPGIGTSTAQTLLTTFKSLKKVEEALPDELTKVIGPAKAKLVYDFLHKNKRENEL